MDETEVTKFHEQGLRVKDQDILNGIRECVKGSRIPRTYMRFDVPVDQAPSLYEGKAMTHAVHNGQGFDFRKH